MSLKHHWEKIYRTKDTTLVGWYQADPLISLQLFKKVHADPSQHIIDVGCGASLLADCLIKRGFHHITLLDLSASALSIVKERLKTDGNLPCYLCRDITETPLEGTFDIWHDRAVFHFLTNAKQREAYMKTLLRVLRPGGHAIIGTFSLNGPDSCSGLDVVRYDGEKMRKELVAGLELVEELTSIHLMPSGTEQEYAFFIIRRAETV